MGEVVQGVALTQAYSVEPVFSSPLFLLFILHSSKCFQDLQILDRSEMAWLDVTATQFEPPSRRGGGGGVGGGGSSIGAIGGYGEHHPDASAHMNPNDLNMSMHDHDAYGMRWRFGGNAAFDRPLSNNDIVSANEGGFPAFDYRDPNNAGGMQEGGVGTPGPADRAEPGFGSPSQLDWRSRDYAMERSRSTVVPVSGGGGANPNDEETVPTVLVHGRGPGRRAGHTATTVNRRIFVFGGSCGSDYLNDFFTLDSDPPPHAVVSEPTSLRLLERRLRTYFNSEEFADVTFVVQGQKVYGHKMILSIVSDCFRAMFTTGFREQQEMEIEIPDCSYEAFLAVMEYIYTGQTPKLEGSTPSMAAGPDSTRDVNLARIVEILELADRFFLDHLKKICETMLQQAVTAETVEVLLPVAQKTNAGQLQAICEHFIRNQQDNNGEQQQGG